METVLKNKMEQIFEDWGYGSNSDKEVCKRLIWELFENELTPPSPNKLMPLEEITVEFIVDGKFVTQPYTIMEILLLDEEKLLQNMESPCSCNPNESRNHCECSPDFDQSEITGYRCSSNERQADEKEVDVEPESDILIATDVCKIIESKKNSLVIGKEYQVVRRENRSLQIISEGGTPHWFDYSGIHSWKKYFKEKPLASDSNVGQKGGDNV